MTDTAESGKASEASKWSDIGIAAVVASALYVILVWVAWTYNGGALWQELVLAGSFGAAFGWVVGILMSPYNQTEKSVFAQSGKLIYGFVTGYLVSKFDKVVSTAIEKADFPIGNTTVILAVCLTSFLIAVSITYITRQYWK